MMRTTSNRELARPALFLTGGVDVQKDRIEVEVVGWGREKQSWSVDYRVIEGDTARADVWAKLDAVLARDWPHASGHTLPIRVMCVDAGYATQDVYAWVRQHPQASWGPAGAAARQPRTAVAVKGRDRDTALLLSVSKADAGGIHAICGADFFDDLITHTEVEKAYERYLDGAFLRQGQARGSFEYAGIVFEEYRGRVGTVDFTDASKAYLFPVGVPGLFRQYNAPADFVETANTIGLPRYAKQAVDQQFARWVMLHVQSNPLPICTRPRVLIKAKRT